MPRSSLFFELAGGISDSIGTFYLSEMPKQIFTIMYLAIVGESAYSVKLGVVLGGVDHVAC
jgi:hypothetical protein